MNDITSILHQFKKGLLSTEEAAGKIRAGTVPAPVYLDVNQVFDDENGNLAAGYSSDGAHVLGKYYSVWVDWIRETLGTHAG